MVCFQHHCPHASVHLGPEARCSFSWRIVGVTYFDRLAARISALVFVVSNIYAYELGVTSTPLVCSFSFRKFYSTRFSVMFAACQEIVKQKKPIKNGDAVRELSVRSRSQSCSGSSSSVQGA